MKLSIPLAIQSHGPRFDELIAPTHAIGLNHYDYASLHSHVVRNSVFYSWYLTIYPIICWLSFTLILPKVTDLTFDISSAVQPSPQYRPALEIGILPPGASTRGSRTTIMECNHSLLLIHARKYGKLFTRSAVVTSESTCSSSF
ncbi:hypothetical protein ARMSODRAFT_171939 [Armillaria solidipes]|uniref:Uncharacterized protein n=1 Tax=Armillaria solidipes TaxID=1076256 RepID=A0A2H3BSK3_9AGAR|nr:hypothetical protein ARMSODRAFT_171939 [Armillaria solidipes]